MATITKKVAASSDDATIRVDESGGYTHVVSDHRLGKQYNISDESMISGFRFLNITIPQGATINSASISMWCSYDSGGTVKVRIYGEDADDAATFASDANPADRVKTTAYVAWDLTSCGAGAIIESPDIKTVIQEIVDRSGWASGNDIVIVMPDDGSTNYYGQETESYDKGLDRPYPTLEIDYTDASIEQEGFAFGTDDGTESAHTLSTQDTNITAPVGTKTLRALLNATGDPASKAFKLKYQKSGSGGYADVPVGATIVTTPVVEAGDCTESGNNTASTSWGVTYPAYVSGDLIIFHLASDADVTHDWSATGPNGETVNTIKDSYGGTAQRVSAFWFVGSGTTSSGNFTVTPSATEQWTAVVIKVLAGEFNSTTPIQSATGEANDTTADTSWATPAWTADAVASGRIVVCAAHDVVTTNAAPEGWTTLKATDRGAVGITVGIRNTANTASENIGSVNFTNVSSETDSSLGYVINAPVITNQVYVSASANVTAGGENTTARLTAPSGKTTSDFDTGRRWDDENGSDSIDITADDYTELEWVLTTQSPATTDNYFEFRVYDGNAALTTYTVTPKWTIGSAETEVDSERDAELKGKSTANSTRDAEIRGKSSSNSERQSETKGKSTGNSERNSELIGITTINSERGSEITGKNTSQSERGAEISGVGNPTSERNAETAGKSTTNSERDVELIGQAIVNSERNVEITGTATGNSERGAEIVGSLSSDSERNAEITGKVLSSSERNSELTGQASANSERASEITGIATNNSEREAEISGQNTSQSERSSEITGGGIPTSERKAEITGQLSENSERDAELSGKVLENSERQAEITGISTSQNERNAEITGSLADNSEREAEIYGQISVNSERGAEIKGFSVSDSERNAEILGALLDNSEREAEITGENQGIDEKTAEITGKQTATNTRNTELTGGIGANPYSGKTSPYSKKTDIYSTKSSPYSKKTDIYSSKTNPYNKLK